MKGSFRANVFAWQSWKYFSCYQDKTAIRTRCFPSRFSNLSSFSAPGLDYPGEEFHFFISLHKLGGGTVNWVEPTRLWQTICTQSNYLRVLMDECSRVFFPARWSMTGSPCTVKYIQNSTQITLLSLETKLLKARGPRPGTTARY